MGLLPSLRQKKRYVVFEIISKQNFTFAEIKEEVERALLQFLGDLGWSQSSPQLVKEKFNPQTQRFILKINHRFVDEVKVALALSKKIKNTPIITRSIVVSGTLKKMQKMQLKRKSRKSETNEKE